MKITVDNKCPSCGANVKFNPTTQKWDCEYCGNSYEIGEFEKQQEKETKENLDLEIDEYTCPNCGATVVTDANTVATHCVYCGNTTIMKNRLQGEFKPDKLIPFKSTKEEAIEEFKKNVKKRWFAPSDFHDEKNIEKITGVYVPFWLYDSQMNGNIQSRATQIRRWSSGNYDYTETSTFRCTRSGELQIEDLPVDGSTKFGDEIMDSIEPYNYSEFKPFNRSYLSGFLAEKYDLNKDEVYDRAKKRMENTMVDELKSTIRGYNSVTIDNSDVNINSGEVEYALLPVWMLNIKFKEKMYTFAMNGQTKKVVGTVPMDSGKVIKKCILFFGISFILFFIFNLMRGMM